MLIKYIYFKDSGKYYSSATEDIPSALFWDVVAMIRNRLQNKIKMPGLSRCWSGYTLAEIDGLPHLFGQFDNIREK